MSEESKEITQEPVAAQAEETKAAAPAEAPKGSKEYNFRRMEQKMREMEARLAQAEAEKAKAAPQQQSLNDDDILTVAEARKMMEREAARIAQEQLQKRDMETLQDRLQAKYADFEQVVSEDAVDALREEHPELFNSLKANPDPYQKGIAAYKLIKNLGKKASPVKENVQKLEENRQKPNMAATQASVLSQATGWTKPSKDQKAALYAEMKSLASRR